MKYLNKSRIASVLAVAFMLVASTGSANAEELRWLTWKAKGAGDAMAENIKWFANEVEKRTDGKVHIQVMWGGSAASQREIPDAISSGVGQIGDIVVPYYMQKFILNNAFGYFIPQPLSPMELANTMEEWHHKYTQFDQELARYNLKVVGYRPLENYGLLCTDPVHKLEDLKGKRIRSYGSAYPALIKALGATPITVSTTEAYQALQRGIIDCTPTGVMYTRAFKYGEIAKYFTAVPLGSNFGQFIVMNLDTYNDLDEEARKAIDSIGKQNVRNFVKNMKSIVQNIRNDWKKNDDAVKYIDVPDDFFDEVINDPAIQRERQSWIDAANKAGLPGEKLAEKMRFSSAASAGSK